jgi:hypothetical protein
MSSTPFQYILASCEIVWGKGDYGLDAETDNWMMYCERSTGIHLVACVAALALLLTFA